MTDAAHNQHSDTAPELSRPHRAQPFQPVRPGMRPYILTRAPDGVNVRLIAGAVLAIIDGEGPKRAPPPIRRRSVWSGRAVWGDVFDSIEGLDPRHKLNGWLSCHMTSQVTDGRCFGRRPTATLRANFRAHPKAETIAAARALGLANLVRQKAVSPVDLILQNPMLVIDEVRDAFR